MSSRRPQPVGPTPAAAPEDPPRAPPPSPPLSRATWAVVCVYRVVAALFMMQTAEAPDEWWQSSEVAYQAAFGRGEVTWEWREGIRSFMYPLPFAAAFSLLHALGLDSAWAVWAAPRVIAGLTCFGIDVATYLVARKYLHPAPVAGQVALLLSLTSWYVSYTGLRTLSNAAEALALLLALLPDSFAGFLAIAGCGCGLRVTFALPLIPLAAARALEALRVATTVAGVTGRSRTVAALRTTVGLGLQAVFFAGLWLGVIAAIDKSFYGRWLCTPLEFLHFNVFRGLSALFGTHPWWWYFPVLGAELGPQALLLLIGGGAAVGPALLRHGSGTTRPQVREALRRQRRFILTVAATALFTAVGYSFLPHKEMRFVFPLVPPLLVVCAAAWVSSVTLWRRRTAVSTVLVVANFLIILVLGTAYQRGTLQVMALLRSGPPPTSVAVSRQAVLEGKAEHALPYDVHVLTGCHATPGYSYVHGVVDELVLTNCTIRMDPRNATRRVPVEHHLLLQYPTAFVQWAYDGLTPDPAHLDPGDRSAGLPDYGIAAADLPAALLEAIPPKSRAVPSCVVLFSKYARRLEATWLRPHGFRMEQRLFHTFFAPDLEFDTHIEIWGR